MTIFADTMVIGGGCVDRVGVNQTANTTFGSTISLKVVEVTVATPMIFVGATHFANRAIGHVSKCKSSKKAEETQKEAETKAKNERRDIKARITENEKRLDHAHTKANEIIRSLDLQHKRADEIMEKVDLSDTSRRSSRYVLRSD